MKILYLISSLANEGPTRVLLNQATYLSRMGCDITVATLVPEKVSSIQAEFELLPVRLKFFRPESKQSRLLGLYSTVHELRQFVDKEGFHIVHSHCPRSLLLAWLCNLQKARTVFTAHIFPPAQFRALYGPLKGWVYTGLVRFLIRRVNLAIACSKSVASEFEVSYGLKIPSVDNGIEPLPLHPEALPRKELLRQLGLDDSFIYALFIGRLSPEKRILELSRLILQSKLTQLKLVVLGTGVEEESLKANAGDRIIVRGFQKNVLPYLRACDFYISPSSTEGLANTLLESMSVGLPSLLSDIPSHKQVIGRSDVWIGNMFDPTKSADFDSAVAKLLSMIRPDSKIQIRDHFMRTYTAQRMSENYLMLYAKVLGT